MNPAAGLSDGNTLHTVDPSLKLEVAISTLAFYKRNDTLVAPGPSFCGFDHIDLEIFDLGILAVHAEQRSGKKRCLVTAGAGADLEEQVFLVSWVFGNE